MSTSSKKLIGNCHGEGGALLENYWRARYYTAEAAFIKIKALTKQVPASQWTPEYRELAELIHTTGRDVFWLEREES